MVSCWSPEHDKQEIDGNTTGINTALFPLNSFFVVVVVFNFKKEEDDNLVKAFYLLSYLDRKLLIRIQFLEREHVLASLYKMKWNMLRLRTVALERFILSGLCCRVCAVLICASSSGSNNKVRAAVCAGAGARPPPAQRGERSGRKVHISACFPPSSSFSVFVEIVKINK